MGAASTGRTPDRAVTLRQPAIVTLEAWVLPIVSTPVKTHTHAKNRKDNIPASAMPSHAATDTESAAVTTMTTRMSNLRNASAWRTHGMQKGRKADTRAMMHKLPLQTFWHLVIDLM
jgi:hypothetical protein